MLKTVSKILIQTFFFFWLEHNIIHWFFSLKLKFIFFFKNPPYKCLFHNPFVSVKHFVPGLRHLLSVLDYIPGGSTVLTLWISLRWSLCRHNIQFNSLLRLLQDLFGCLFIWGMYDMKHFLLKSLFKVCVLQIITLFG